MKVLPSAATLSAGDALDFSLLELATGLLAKKEYSTLQLSQLLLDSGYLQEQVDPVVTHLIEHSWLSDRRYAELTVAHLLEHGYGPYYIEQELQQSGVPTEVFQDILAPVNWSEQIKQIALKRYGTVEFSDPKLISKISRYFERRGFQQEQLMRALLLSEF